MRSICRHDGSATSASPERVPEPEAVECQPRLEIRSPSIGAGPGHDERLVASRPARRAKTHPTQILDEGAVRSQLGGAGPLRRSTSLPAILIVISALGCSAGSTTGQTTSGSTPAADTGTSVSLTVTAQQQNKQLRISGTTNLPDGAIVAFEVAATDLNVNEFADGTATVGGGRFSSSVDVSEWPSGNVEVWAAFQTVLGHGEQPQAILDRYGKFGEKLTGPNVVKTGDFYRVETTTTYELRGLGS